MHAGVKYRFFDKEHRIFQRVRSSNVCCEHVEGLDVADARELAVRSAGEVENDGRSVRVALVDSDVGTNELRADVGQHRSATSGNAVLGEEDRQGG